MIRRPPRSTLFPTRRSSDLAARWRSPTDRTRPKPHAPLFARWSSAPRRAKRSEEHTSELQSRQYLVCRLLLEKKTYQPVRRPPRHTYTLNKHDARRPSPYTG